LENVLWLFGQTGAFVPESGKAKFIIPDAYLDRVAALSIFGDHEIDRQSWCFFEWR